MTYRHNQTPDFTRRIRSIRERFFSRDARLWPIFADPAFASVIDFRRQHLPPHDALAAYPGGAAELAALRSDDTVPRSGMDMAAVNRRLVFSGALSKAWENPSSVENVITTPCDAAIHGAALGLLANPNLVYSEYMGTTDTFAVDRVKPVREISERLADKFNIACAPHIHVDSAVGWPLIFFLDYDFAKNPLQILDSTLAALQRNTDRFRELRYADSFTVDFQKWGYVPYTSSLVMVKDRASMKYLEHDPENFTYFEKDVQGQTHLQSTIECSRGAAGLFGAYAALQALGKEGYQTLIAHGLQNAHYFRCRLNESPGAVVVAAENGGPSVGFRLYDPHHVKDPAAELALEKAAMTTAACRARLTRNTAYHRAVFLARGKAGLYTNWIQYVTHTAYDDKGAWTPIPGEKAVFFNPHTDQEHIDTFVARLHGAPGGSPRATASNDFGPGKAI